MNVKNPVKPGWFFKDGQPYLALAQLPRMLNLTDQEIEEGVAVGELRVERVSGCRIVAVGEVFTWIEMKQQS